MGWTKQLKQNTFCYILWFHSQWCGVSQEKGIRTDYHWIRQFLHCTFQTLESPNHKCAANLSLCCSHTHIGALATRSLMDQSETAKHISVWTMSEEETWRNRKAEEAQNTKLSTEHTHMHFSGRERECKTSTMVNMWTCKYTHTQQYKVNKKIPSIP